MDAQKRVEAIADQAVINSKIACIQRRIEGNGLVSVTSEDRLHIIGLLERIGELLK